MSGESFSEVTARFLRTLFDALEDGEWDQDTCEMRLQHVIEKAATDVAYSKGFMSDLIEADWNTRLERDAQRS